MIKAVPNLARVQRVTIEQEFFCICPFGDTPYAGNAQIEYWPTENLIELFSLNEFARNLSTHRLIAEDACRSFFDEVLQALGDTPLRVTVSVWTNVHAPIEAQIDNME